MSVVQDTAIASLVKVMRAAHAEERKTLFVVGSYHIGKERAFFGAATALGFKIWCHAAKKQVLLCIQRSQWLTTLTLRSEPGALNSCLSELILQAKSISVVLVSEPSVPTSVCFEAPRSVSCISIACRSFDQS